MRVITGSARGMRLEAPEGMDVRPTTDKVKESIFNIIQFNVEGSRVLDLFAGSGQLGIEALSRGARSAVFLDCSPASLEYVRANLEHTGFQDRAEVRCMDSLRYLSSTAETFDLAFLDPPYRRQILPEALNLLVPRMSRHGLTICESASEEELPASVLDYKRARDYRYGKIKLTVYRSKEEFIG